MDGREKSLEKINAKLNINLTEEQYDRLALLDCCTKDYTAYEILEVLSIVGLIPAKTPNNVGG